MAIRDDRLVAQLDPWGPSEAAAPAKLADPPPLDGVWQVELDDELLARLPDDHPWTPELRAMATPVVNVFTAVAGFLAEHGARPRSLSPLDVLKKMPPVRVLGGEGCGDELTAATAELLAGEAPLHFGIQRDHVVIRAGTVIAGVRLGRANMRPLEPVVVMLGDFRVRPGPTRYVVHEFEIRERITWLARLLQRSNGVVVPATEQLADLTAAFGADALRNTEADIALSMSRDALVALDAETCDATSDEYAALVDHAVELAVLCVLPNLAAAGSDVDGPLRRAADLLAGHGGSPPPEPGVVEVVARLGRHLRDVAYPVRDPQLVDDVGPIAALVREFARMLGRDVDGIDFELLVSDAARHAAAVPPPAYLRAPSETLRGPSVRFSVPGGGELTLTIALIAAPRGRSEVEAVWVHDERRTSGLVGKGCLYKGERQLDCTLVRDGDGDLWRIQVEIGAHPRGQLWWMPDRTPLCPVERGGLRVHPTGTSHVVADGRARALERAEVHCGYADGTTSDAVFAALMTTLTDH